MIKVKLALPEKSKIPQYIKINLSSFARNILNEPNKPNSILLEDGMIKISYHPKARYNSGGYPVFTIPLSPKNNPIYNRLKSKYKHLKKTNYSGITGMFLCDGDCYALKKNSLSSSGAYTRDEIINKFLDEQTTVDFIGIFSIENSHSSTQKYIQVALRKSFNSNLILFLEIGMLQFPLTIKFPEWNIAI